MKEKIDLEWLVMEEVLNNLPSAKEEDEFLHKYVEPDKNFDIEDDSRNMLFAVDRQSFLAGFRTAMALAHGEAELDINKLIQPWPSKED